MYGTKTKKVPPMPVAIDTQETSAPKKDVVASEQVLAALGKISPIENVVLTYELPDVESILSALDSDEIFLHHVILSLLYNSKIPELEIDLVSDTFFPDQEGKYIGCSAEWISAGGMLSTKVVSTVRRMMRNHARLRKMVVDLIHYRVIRSMRPDDDPCVMDNNFVDMLRARAEKRRQAAAGQVAASNSKVTTTTPAPVQTTTNSSAAVP